MGNGIDHDITGSDIGSYNYCTRRLNMKYIISLLVLVLLPFFLFSQKTNVDSTEKAWSFGLQGYFYFVPDENTYTLIGTADHKAWHFEGRYNYEDEKTGSLFVGHRFEWGKKFVFGATPMLGLVVGNTDGIAPGLELDASYGIFDFYSETEYVIDFAAKENNFFYTWSEIAVSPLDFLRAGVSAQRTRLYQTGRELNRGIFTEFSLGKLTAGLHYYMPFSSNDFFIASLNFEF
jgi:hypothetical protein